jgi:hypothetical protein
VNEDAAELVLHASQRKNVTLLAISALFVGGGYWMTTGGEDFWGWFSVVFFGLCGLAAVSALLKRGSLRLTHEGFYVKHLGRGSFTSRWNECDRFRTWSAAVGVSFVSFDWTPASSRSGFGTLPDTYGMKATELARLMQRRRDSAVGEDAPAG